MSEGKNRFRDKLTGSDDFVVTFELVPGRSGRGRTARKVMSFAEQAAEHGRLAALTLTDNPGGNPSLSPDELGRRIINLGMDTVVHMTCRDANRSGIFSRSQQLDTMGVRNLLVLTGDYPAECQDGQAKPCFDLDAVSLICFLNNMNRGNASPCMHGQKALSENTDFFLGAAVSCSKYSESEQIAQYCKLIRKIRNGAQYVTTQLCYDARKFDELFRFVESTGLSVPLLGTVYVLTEPAARFMNKGGVPGACVSDELYETVAREAQTPDRGKAASLERSARLMAVLKGIGYRGAHISGKPDYDDIRRLLTRFEQLQDKWRDFVPELNYGRDNGFYLFEEDPATGLNLPGRAPRAARSLGSWAAFHSFHGFHESAFNDEQPWFPALKRIAGLADRHRCFGMLYSTFEHTSKKILFDCRKCGDCALAEMAYVCPEAKCPKFLRNGPCGGSSNTRCEVFPERRCAWVTVYERLKAVGRDSELGLGCVPPRNWSLDQTSSWLNFYLARDHHHTDKILCPSGNK